jgi:hypothetical protein
MSQTSQAGQPAPAGADRAPRRIPPPAGAREPLKVNVYERMTDASCQLMPLFPYRDAGAIVPCGAIFTGEPGDGKFGHFFHYNTVEEVAVTYGASDAMLATGQIFVTQRLHGVNSFLRNPDSADAFVLMTITQRQSEGGDQGEAIIFRCQNCHAELLRYDYDATPPGVDGYNPAQWGGAADDEIPMFVTLWGTLEAARQYSQETIRTCGQCGHVNEEHPVTKWGWQRWIDQSRTAGQAKAAMRAAAAAAASADPKAV